VSGWWASAGGVSAPSNSQNTVTRGCGCPTPKENEFGVCDDVDQV
jgi:hypothetical protein